MTPTWHKINSHIIKGRLLKKLPRYILVAHKPFGCVLQKKKIILRYNIDPPCSAASLLMVKLDDVIGNTQLRGRWLFRLESSAQVLPPRTKCLDWFRVQESLSIYINSTSKFLDPCPCHFWQAWIDPRFSMNSSEFCAYSSWAVPFLLPGSHVAYLSRKCCYNRGLQNGLGFGALIKGRKGGHLLVEYQSYLDDNAHKPGIYTDYEARRFCCDESLECKLFYTMRPSNKCKKYRLPLRCKSLFLLMNLQ